MQVLVLKPFISIYCKNIFSLQSFPSRHDKLGKLSQRLTGCVTKCEKHWQSYSYWLLYIEVWKTKSSKSYWKKKHIEPFCIHILNDYIYQTMNMYLKLNFSVFISNTAFGSSKRVEVEVGIFLCLSQIRLLAAVRGLK